MKKLIVTVLILGLTVLVIPQTFAAASSSGNLSVGEVTVVRDGATVTGSGTGWVYNNGVLTLNGYYGAAIAATDMGELTMALTPGTTNIITGPSSVSAGAGIVVGANTILIIQGAIGAALDVMGSGTMETGIYGSINTANIIFSMAEVNIIGVSYSIFSYGSVELQNSSKLIASSPHGICLSGAPLTINQSVLSSNGSNNGMMVDNHSLMIENGSVVTAFSANGDGINVINGAIMIDHSVVSTTGITGINAMGGSVSINNESQVTTTSAAGDGIYADRNIYISDSVVEAVGGGQGGLFSFSEILIAGSRVTASSTEGISIRADTGGIHISSGTITAPEGISADAITITGGSLDAPSSLVTPQPVDGQGQPVFKTGIILPGLPAGRPVTEMVGPPDDYDVTGIVTDDTCLICPWLPAGSIITCVTADKQQFIGQIPGGTSGSLMPTAAIAPTITNTSATLIAGKGSSASLIITASGNPAPTFSAALANGDPLPAWITLDSTSGNLTATPTSNLVLGNYIIRVTATNSTGTATKDFTVRVDAVPPTGDSGVLFFTGITALFALLALCGMVIWRRKT